MLNKVEISILINALNYVESEMGFNKAEENLHKKLTELLEGDKE